MFDMIRRINGLVDKEFTMTFTDKMKKNLREKAKGFHHVMDSLNKTAGEFDLTEFEIDEKRFGEVKVLPCRMEICWYENKEPVSRDVFLAEEDANKKWVWVLLGTFVTAKKQLEFEGRWETKND